MKYICTILISLAITVQLSAQVPAEFRYQARLHDQSGQVMANQPVVIHINIRQGNPDGNQVFGENHQVTTGSDGLVSLSVGSENDLTLIDWSRGPYYLEVLVDGNVIGTSEILSVPYALHAGIADSVAHISYNQLIDAPDFTGWDKNAGDDFDGDYNSLTNQPVTITPEQSAKIDSITISAAVNLDSLKSLADSNSEKVSFPGFGTVPGKALEGDHIIWSKADTNIFYTPGSVGIGVPVNSDFGGSVLHVGGGILYDGIPASGSPGVMFYDTTGSGGFKYYDNDMVLRDISSGSLSYTGVVAGSDQGDITLNNDLILRGSLAVGNDAVNGEDFGYSTVILKENNLRILFDDTDDPAGSYPSNDWQIIINDSNNGGQNYFGIADETHGTVPFKIMGGAPDSSLYIGPNGFVGIGTYPTSAALEVNGTVRADAFIGDGSGLTGITGGTGGISNADNTVIAADTDSDTNGIIDFQTQDSSRMVITNDGKVGIGTQFPEAELDVNGTVKAQNVDVTGTVTASSLILTIVNDNITGAPSVIFDATGKSMANINADAPTTIEGFQGGISGQTITLINNGSNTVTIRNNGTGTQKVLLPGPDIILGGYQSASFVCNGTDWYCTAVQN